ncbi:putative disease resistance protein RGA1 [Silene latifolia]|uniref:putative disease resistance protein RGA1 n=1 Tax=Silene latifolia TaxID=37657 RepID=UPI003D76E8E8
MADLGTLITIADKVFQLLQSPVLKDMKDWKSDVENLNNSVSFIKNMLLDAEAKPELSHGEKGWVDELNEVLYEADDLFDEVITTAKQKELNAGAKFSKNVLDKVSRFFSSKNHILLSYKTSQEVKSIRQKLDAIAKDHARYEFKVDPLATLKRKEETCSFLDETHENIIGREDDVKLVLDMLLDPNVEENVEFVVIVGIGGLGKTALARLVYNHDRLGTTFEKKLWACVSDQDGKELNVKAILANIIESSTNEKPSNVSTMQSMQTKLQEELKNKTYLLILDDVWTEDPYEWSKLRKYLTIGGWGSRVVITTRLEKTADVILGNAAHPKKYMLKGLSDDDSWRLFVSTAFERESEAASDPELTKIGKNIVTKCSNVPLAIKVLGTLLYGQTHRWELFEKNRLPQIETDKNPIMSILKLSYNNLQPSVKNCFRYCALFPKDFQMDKRELISLWMAQGYIGDSEDCFLILLKRCFFQDVEIDDLGNIISFKMHDLMHDLAQEVAGDTIIVTDSMPNNLSKKNRHLFVDEEVWTNSFFPESNIRTCYMNSRVYSDVVKTLVANCRFLRSLRLSLPDAEFLPESIGQLLHLRYLDLSKSFSLKTLPNSISKLYNLQSLVLQLCVTLKEWPKDFCKLVNLRLLDIKECPGLTCMPLGIDQLTNLHDLSHFKVGGVSSIGKQIGGQLKDLKLLVNLRGELEIKINKNLVIEKENKWEGGYLEHIKNLKVISIIFHKEAGESNNEALIEKLQPNSSLMELSLENYNGTEIPRWGRAHDDWSIILPNLVYISLSNCESLHGIPLLSKLKHLKELSLSELNNLEYMETNKMGSGGSGSKDLPFFPSLEVLEIVGLRRLKGWWEGIGEGDGSSSMPHWQPLPFPRLSNLLIESCPELTFLPPCPTLEFLKVRSSKSLRILLGPDVKLDVEVDSAGYLTTLPARHLTHIWIENDDELQRLSEIEEVFKSSSSLQGLEIKGCRKLTSVSGVFEHLTALESLSLDNIPVVDEEFDDDMPWKSLRHNLRYLELKSLETLQMLPRGMKYLTALESLSIKSCRSLKGLPEWISCLSSLQFLTIVFCTGLKSLGALQNITSLKKLEILNCSYELREACEEPSGKEWANICHIPHISFDVSSLDSCDSD